MPKPARVIATGYSTGSARGASQRTTNHPVTDTAANTTP